MGLLISGSELVKIAVGIEKNGAAFYDSMTKSTGDERARDMYSELADKERMHVKIFQNMASQAGDYQPPETYTEEYDLYMKALVDSSVFINDEAAREMAQRVTSDIEALQIGINAEKDSILFYSEMRELVHQSDRKVIDHIIDEERSHLKQLSGLKKKLGKG
jgi:rubrerythrin